MNLISIEIAVWVLVLEGLLGLLAYCSRNLKND
jgi:hypothetical protein